MRAFFVSLRSMRKWISLCFLAAALTACTEPWQLEVEPGQSRLVITGAVGSIPDTYSVYVTRNDNYFSDTPYSGVANACVSINGIALSADPDKPGRYLTAPDFAAIAGETYTLEVWADGDGDGAEEYYTASEVAPPVVPILSLSLMPIVASSANKALPASTLIAFQDPVGPNYYGAHLYITTAQDSNARYQTLRYSDVPDKYITNMFSAMVEDGSLIFYPAFMLTRHEALSLGDSITIFPYDTLTVELNNHSEAYFTFVNQLQTSMSGSNPLFMSPSGQLTGNVEGGAMGCFGVYGAFRSKVAVGYTTDTWSDEDMERRFGKQWRQIVESEQ